MRFGIVGIGGIAKCAHIPALLELKQEIVSLCDINLEHAKEGLKLINKDLPIYDNYIEMFEKENLDAVAICTPNYLHHEITISALKHNLHVLCEKPDAIKPEYAELMAKTAKEHEKTLMIVRNNRFLPNTVFLKKMINDGKIGEIYSGRCGWVRRRGIPGKGGWFTTKALSGGGPLIDLGVHMIDLAVYLMGSPKPVSVSGAIYNKFANKAEISDSIHSNFGEKVDNGTFDVEDLAMGFVKFANGACLQIEVSWASNIKSERNFVELRGEEAGFTWTDRSLEIYSEEYGTTCDLNPNIDFSYGGHLNNYKNFINVILDKEEPIFKVEEGINIMKIIDGIYKSAETGKEVIL